MTLDKIQGCRTRDNDSGCDDPGYGVEALTRRVFQRFGRFSKDEEGHGIDLSIVRELVERLNTDVKLKSDVGKGNEFALIF